MLAVKLYYIKLEDDCYFLEVGTNTDDIVSTVLEKCTESYSYVKAHPPIGIIDVLFGVDPLHIDTHVLKLMQKYGIERVRGGTYWEENLPDFLVKSIELQLKTTQHYLESPDLPISTNKITPFSIKNDGGVEDEYRAFKFFESGGHTYTFNREYLRNELSWLWDHIEDIIYKHAFHIENHETKEMKTHIHERYSKLLIYMKEFPRLYLRVVEKTERDINMDFDTDDSKVYLRNPEFLLDQYVFHYKNHANRLSQKRETLILFRDLIMDMYYTVSTHFSELEFEYYNP